MPLTEDNLLAREEALKRRDPSNDIEDEILCEKANNLTKTIKIPQILRVNYWVVFNYLGTFGEEFINDGLRSSKKKIYQQDQKSCKNFLVKSLNRYIVSVVRDVRIAEEV